MAAPENPKPMVFGHSVPEPDGLGRLLQAQEQGWADVVFRLPPLDDAALDLAREHGVGLVLLIPASIHSRGWYLPGGAFAGHDDVLAQLELAAGLNTGPRTLAYWNAAPEADSSCCTFEWFLDTIQAEPTTKDEFCRLFHVFLRDEVLGGEERILPRYLKPDLLIIDDMGIKQLPKRSGEYLFEIIMRRYENRSTMMTSNRPIEDWGKLIGDVPSATAILDRFLHHAEIIAVAGRSYRLKDTANHTSKEEGTCKSDQERV